MSNETEHLIIEIPDQKKEAREQALEVFKQRLDFHQNLIYAVLLVVGVGFIAVIIAVFDIFISTNRFAADQLASLRHVIETNQADKSNAQYQSLQNSIESLRKDISSASSTQK